MINFLNSKYLDKLIEIPDFIDTFHSTDFKITDIVNNDMYRNMNDSGLFDYDYIDRGEKTVKGATRKASTTNLVFLIWLMIVLDLKKFGFKIDQLKKVKQYLFKEFDILENINFPIDKESLLKKLNSYEFENKEIKSELSKRINSGQFLTGVQGQTASCMFMTLYKMIVTGKDIQLYINSSGEAIFIDEFDLSDEDIKELSFESRITLPLKKYLCYFIGEYAPLEYLTRSKILSEKEAMLLDEFRRNDIVSLTVKYHNGKPNTIETRKYKKMVLQNKLSNIFLQKDYEDIIIKTRDGNIYYSELTTKLKL